jgi:hypothetical protein
MIACLPEASIASRISVSLTGVQSYNTESVGDYRADEFNITGYGAIGVFITRLFEIGIEGGYLRLARAAAQESRGESNSVPLMMMGRYHFWSGAVVPFFDLSLGMHSLIHSGEISGSSYIRTDHFIGSGLGCGLLLKITDTVYCNLSAKYLFLLTGGQGLEIIETEYDGTVRPARSGKYLVRTVPIMVGMTFFF